VIQLRSGSATDVGRFRSKNEDTPFTRDGLYAVADGMGGHRGGDVASQIAVEVLAEEFQAPDAVALLDAVHAANDAVYGHASDDPDLRGMGTTLIAIAPVSDGDHDTVAWVHVGDSRIYLFRDGELTQLTEDHTLVEEMVRDGRIAPEDARSHPQRNIVTRALGIDADVLIDAGTVDPYEGDRFLLCSDGLFNEVEEPRIAATLRRLADPKEAADELVRLANEHGGRDNITVVVVDLADDGDVAEAASAALAGREGTVESHADRDGDGAEPSRAERRAARREERGRVVTWRVALFAGLFVVILLLAAGALGYYARRTYYVGFEGDRVAIFKGKPGGVLWFDPTLEETTRIDRDDVPAARLAQLDDGREVSSLDEAEEYLENLEDQIERSQPTTTTTSTTATTLPGTPTSVP
jgi:PPM family protein phosphatase